MSLHLRSIIFFLLYFVNLSALPFYYPDVECGFFFDGAVEGIYVENPDIGFYGLYNANDTPAVVWSTNCLGTRWSGAAGWTGRPVKCYEPIRIMAAASYFDCGFKGKKNLENGGPIQIFHVAGGGAGGTIPETQNNFFHFCQKEIHAGVFVSSTYSWCGGIVFYPAIGYSFISQDQSFDSRLINFENNFNNGTIHEALKTAYQGMNLEVAVAKRFFSSWVLTIIPTFGVYRACTELQATQNWGQNNLRTPLIPQKDVYQTAYQGSLRGGLFWQCSGYHIGGTAFADYLSYVPGILNPREDDDDHAYITKKTSFRYGGGLLVGRHF